MGQLEPGVGNLDRCRTPVAKELETPEERAQLFDFAGRVVLRQFAPMERDVDRVMTAHVRQRQDAVALGIVLSCISPLAPYTYMLTDMARTGVQDELHFRN